MKVIVWFRDLVKVMVRKGAWLKLAPFGITKMAVQVTFDVSSNENSQERGHGKTFFNIRSKLRQNNN